MATRRPNMPRANRAAGHERSGHPSAGRDGVAAPEAQAHDGGNVGSEPAGREKRGGESRPGAPRTGPDARAKVVPLGAVPGSESPKPAARRPVKRPSAQPTGNRSPQRPQRPASEQRLRERTELSGSIRAPRRTGGPPPSKSAHSGTTAGNAPVPARSFSGRMLALAVVLVAITILLLPSVGTYMNQRAEIGELRESIAAKQGEQAELNEQIARWDDPVYIKQQARDRINLVMPGERKYMVIGSSGEDPAIENESPGEVRTDLPWVDALWDTVKRSATD